MYTLCWCTECKGQQTYSVRQARRHVRDFGAYDPLGLAAQDENIITVTLVAEYENFDESILQVSDMQLPEQHPIPEAPAEPLLPVDAAAVHPELQFMLNMTTLCQTLSGFRASGIAEKDIVSVVNACWTAVKPFLPEEMHTQLPGTAYKINLVILPCFF